MLDINEIRDALSGHSKKYSEEKKEIMSQVENLNSSRYQMRILASEVANFKKEVETALSGLESGEEAVGVVLESFNQLVKFITDKPTIIDFNLEKAQQAIFKIDDFMKSLSDIESELVKRQQTLVEIKSNLEEDPDAYLSRKRKPGTRPEKFRDVRKMKSIISENSRDIEESVDQEEDSLAIDDNTD